jgi:pimeloyl-ACP methyl ester carboxylesterase
MPTNIHFILEHNLKPIDYHSVFQTMRNNPLTVDVASPQWDDTFENIVAEAQAGVDVTPGERPIIIGHGDGGDLALGAVAGAQREIGGLIIASPGVLSAEAMEYPEVKATLMERFPGQQNDISRYSSTTLARLIGLHPSQVAILVGEREVKAHPYIGELAEATAAAFNERNKVTTADSRVEVTVVPKAPHLIELSPQYINHLTAAAFMIYEAGRNL